MAAVPPRTRYTTTFKTAPNCASSVELCALEKRKERKRVTDREAQREHRKRKRQYVEELEAKIEFLKRHHASSQAAELLKENEELRKEVESLRSFFKDVSDLVTNARSPSHHIQSTSSTSAEQDITGSETDSTTQHLSQTVAPPALHTASPVTEVDLRSLDLDPQLDVQAFANGGNVESNTAGLTAWEAMTFHDTMGLDPPYNVVSTDSAESTNDAFNGLGHQNEGSMSWLSQPVHVPHVGEDDAAAALPPGTSHGMLGLEETSHFSDTTLLDHNPSTPCWPWLGNWPPFHAAESRRHQTGRFHFHFPHGLSAEAMQTFALNPTNNAMVVETGASWTASFEQHLADVLGRPRHQKTLPAKPAWLCFPILLSPPMSSDSRLQDFMGKFHEAGSTGSQQKMPKPTMLDFLVNSDFSSALPRAVKQYLAPLWTSMQLPELLASFWIISLLARVSFPNLTVLSLFSDGCTVHEDLTHANQVAQWYINRDEESFYDLPAWLRPTLFQSRIVHPLAVCFMPWPILRDELILIALTDPAAATNVMAGLGTHLQINLCPGQRSHKAGKDTFEHNTGSLNDPSSGAQPDMTWESLADLRNWTLHDQFFAQFPQFREAYQQSQQMLVGFLQKGDDNHSS